MDILNSLGSVLGGSGDGKQNDILGSVMNLIGGQSGGLAGLVQQFASKGLGDVVNSWVGTGSNLPISANQIQDVLGSDAISGIASKLGINASDVSQQLSNFLPQVVDKLTPEGKVPEGDILSQGMNLLGGLFGK